MTKSPIKMRKGRGVLAKDGVTPWAARTLHYTQKRVNPSTGNLATWKSPCSYTMANMVALTESLMLGQIDSIQLIDENNVQTVYELRAAAKRALDGQ